MNAADLVGMYQRAQDRGLALPANWASEAARLLAQQADEISRLRRELAALPLYSRDRR